MTKELCVTHGSIVVQSGSLALVYGRSPCVFERELRPHKMEILCVFCAQVSQACFRARTPPHVLQGKSSKCLSSQGSESGKCYSEGFAAGENRGFLLRHYR